MSTTIEYKIVTTTDGVERFEKIINAHLLNGWTLYGKSFGVGNNVAQALVLKEHVNEFEDIHRVRLQVPLYSTAESCRQILTRNEDVEKPKDVEEPKEPKYNVCMRCGDTGWLPEDGINGCGPCYCRMGKARLDEWTKAGVEGLIHFKTLERVLKHLCDGLAKLLKDSTLVSTYDGSRHVVAAADIESLLKALL